MERSRIVPHISWSGPCPDREDLAYLLAMLVRIYAGLDQSDEAARDPLMHPSVLTTENLPMIAMMYAYYTAKLKDAGIRDTEDMLKLIKATKKAEVDAWIPINDEAIHKSEAELLEFVDTHSCSGFRCFG